MTEPLFTLSAFADEYDPSLAKQLAGLRENGITLIEPRFADGKNISDLNDDEAAQLRDRLDAAGIGISALGSPLGKIRITDPMEPPLEKLVRTLKTAKILGAARIRMFSFFIPEGEHEKWRDEVMRRLALMLEMAEGEGITLCHENEKGIWGDTPERCLAICNEFGGRMPLVFDHANFIDCGVEPYPYAFSLLKGKFAYLHIKDSIGNCQYYPAGKGACRIPETLRDLAAEGKPYILTLEPHLKVFSGMAALEKEDSAATKEKNTYASNAEAFRAAADALKQIISEL